MRNRLFMLVLAAMLACGLLCIVHQREVSSLERKYLAVNEDLKETQLSDRSFQKTLEQIVSDQLIMKDELIQLYYQCKQKLYAPVSSGLLKVKDDVLYLPEWDIYIRSVPKQNPENEKTASGRGYNLNAAAEMFPDVKFYVYKPTRLEETELLYLYGENSYGMQYQKQFLQQLSSRIVYRELEINSIEDYQKWYYKTDLHWNIDGAYQGYSDIINMLREDFDIEEPREIEEKYCFPQDFYGSLANHLGQTTAADHICDLKLKGIPKFTLTENSEYVEEYKKQLYSEGYKEEAYSDYEYYFGSNELERIYQFEGNEDKPNVLMFVDSFSNPIRTWLSSHFNTAVLIDLRSLTDRESFDLAKIIEDYKIDAVVVTMYYDNLFFNGYNFIPLPE